MGLLTTAIDDIEIDAETAFKAIEQFIDDTVWPDLKTFLSVFDPLEAKALLADLIGAIPTAETGNLPGAAIQVATQIGPQTVANAKVALAAVTAQNAPAATPANP